MGAWPIKTPEERARLRRWMRHLDRHGRAGFLDDEFAAWDRGEEPPISVLDALAEAMDEAACLERETAEQVSPPG